MAVITTAITPTQRLFPFSGYEDNQGNRSNFPRGEIWLTALGESITLSGVGDTQIVSLSSALPVNFAWCLVDMDMKISATVGDTYGFDLDFECRVSDSTSTPLRTFFSNIGLHSEGVNAAGSAGTVEEAVYHAPAGLFKGVILPATPAQQVELFLRGFNSTTNQGAYLLDFTARFLQFDIVQAHDLHVNNAIPTR